MLIDHRTHYSMTGKGDSFQYAGPSNHFAYKYPYPSLPKHKLCYLLISFMAETFLRSVRDAVNREYDYIVIGTYSIHSVRT